MIAFDDITLGHAVMDRDHADSLDLWTAATAAPAGALAHPFAAFAAHLRAHFAREEALMTEHGFFALHCHSAEHARVLARIASLQSALTPETEDAARRYLRSDFPDWFHNHLSTMDRVTAGYLVGVGDSC